MDRFCKTDEYAFWDAIEIKEALHGKTILVTGATGMIASAIIRTLCFLSAKEELSINIVALTRSVQKAAGIFAESPALQIAQWSENWEAKYAPKANCLIHCASITDSKTFVHRPAETIDSVVLESRRVLEFIRRTPGCRMVYLSSMEVYGTHNYPHCIVREDDYGYLDILAPRSSYPQAKALTETMCSAYAHEFNCHISIARLCQILTTDISENDQRMFAQFIHAARRDGNIVLHTTGDTIRTYCSMPDCISALLYILIRGKSAEAYNVANEAMTHSVREIADMVAQRYQCAVIHRPDSHANGYLPRLNMPVSAEKLRGLGWKPQIGTKEILEDLW